MALTNKLSAIGNAIRQKTGKTELLTLDAMPAEILGIVSGGGGELPDEAFLITGNAKYRFCFDGWNWYLNEYKDKITTKDLTATDYMFYCNKNLEDFPNITFNFKPNTNLTCSYMFNENSKVDSLPSIDFNQTAGSGYTTDMSGLFIHCNNVKSIGTIKNVNVKNVASLFANCHRLRYTPFFENVNFDYLHNNATSSNAVFNACYSMRGISTSFLKEIYSLKQSSVYTSHLYNMFQSCYVLDEIIGVSPQTATLTSNAFGGTFSGCYRVKDIIFDTQEDGTPYKANWKNQTIALNGAIGYSLTANFILTYNSGITLQDEVTDDTTYNNLKMFGNWFSTKAEYSRYNHDSAVNTINSLPDVSGNTGNTIKFNAKAGSKTDGGAINTLTEEEIAVAAAKGWTVSLV